MDSQATAKTRAKPRTKKPAAFGDAEDAEDLANMKKVKRRCVASVLDAELAVKNTRLLTFLCVWF